MPKLRCVSTQQRWHRHKSALASRRKSQRSSSHDLTVVKSAVDFLNGSRLTFAPSLQKSIELLQPQNNTPCHGAAIGHRVGMQPLQNCKPMVFTTKSKDLMTKAGLNLIQQALTIYDTDLKLVICNNRFKEMFNLPESLVTTGATFGETIEHLAKRGEYGAVDDIDEFIKERIRVARAFEPHYMERKRANGQVISVEGAPLPQGGWVTVYTDITRIRHQEDLLRSRSEVLSDQVFTYAAELASKNRALEAANAALEETQRQLIESEQRTRLTSEMMPAHIAHVDRDRRYTYSNRRLSSVMPHRPNDIIGRPISETLGKQAYSQIEANLNSAFNGHPSVFEFIDDLSSRHIRTAFTPDKDGDVIQGVYILSMDVTEETQARAALQQASKRELAAQLTSGLAHDFSNLLTIILGAQGRLKPHVSDPKALDLISATTAAASRGGALLNTIADMTGTRALKPEAVRVHEVLERLETLVHSTLPSDITFQISNTIPDTAYLLDKGMLQDALLNLIINARDAIGTEGSIKLTASIVQETWLEFIVTDSGPGFSERALRHALDPFFTTKGEHGTGLGLPMVYDMVKLSGGELKLGNNYGGARVTLRLPIREGAPTLQNALTLLVEDNTEIRESLRDELTSLGHSVVEASSAEEATALLSGLPEISFILSDLQLRGEETGLSLLEVGKNKGILFMTSLPVTHPLRIEAAQHAHVLSKPIDDSILRNILAKGTAL